MEGPAPRGRLAGWLVPVGAVVVFLALLIGVDWGSGDPVDGRAVDVPDPSIPTSLSIPTTLSIPSPAEPTVTPASRVARGDRLEELVPGLDGTLLAVVGQGGRIHSLYLWHPEDSFPETWPLPANASSFALNPTGTLFGYLTFGVDHSEGDTLWVMEPGGTAVQVAEQVAEQVVGGFAFSGTQPGYLAWIGRDPDTLATSLFTTRVSTPLDPRDPFTDPEAFGVMPEGTVLLGWNDGWVWTATEDRATGETRIRAFSTRDGLLLAEYSWSKAVVGPRGHRVLLGRTTGPTWTFAAVGWDPGIEPDPLDWAPTEPSGQYQFVAWSASDMVWRLAFIGSQGQPDSWVEVWELSRGDDHSDSEALNGTLVHRVEFGYRIWDVEWSSSDRFVLMPGNDDQSGRSVLLVLDTQDGSLDEIEFPDPVQYADVIPTTEFGQMVPGVVGLDLEQARAALIEAGFAVEVSPTAGDPAGRAVWSQMPAGGERARLGSVVGLDVVGPDPDPALFDAPLGGPGCNPPSPTAPWAGLTETRGTADFEVWALLWRRPPWQVGEWAEMEIHLDVDNARDVTFSAEHEDGTIVEPIWGPEYAGSGSSNHDRPGDEWRMAFALPEAGCWAIHIDIDGQRSAGIWIEVG